MSTREPFLTGTTESGVSWKLHDTIEGDPTKVEFTKGTTTLALTYEDGVVDHAFHDIGLEDLMREAAKGAFNDLFTELLGGLA